MVDEKVLGRWLALEAHRMNQGLVTDGRRMLTLLLLDEAPQVRTVSDSMHVFDKDALSRFAAPLSRLTRARVELPITFHLDHEGPGSCVVPDRPAREALAEAGLVPVVDPSRPLWLATTLARRLTREYPTVFQSRFG